MSETIDAPALPRPDEQLDPERLRPFLERAFPGERGPISVLQFQRGHSNLTYLVTMGAHAAVLRRPPFGVTVKSAHDMQREFTILSAVHGSYPKAPRPLAFCDDEQVLGAKFYLMERREGVVFRSEAPPPGLTFTPELLRGTSTALVDNLADLHAVDYAAAGLANLGKPQGYVARQVSGWTDRYAKAQTDDVPGVDQAARWLAAHLPAESRAALIHNDYKYDNVMFDPRDLTRIVAVLDWEMATIGDPLMDLGGLLGYWADPDDPPELRARPYGPTFLPGSLSRVQLVERYAARTGKPTGDMLFQYVFALFKIAVILQQIYKRFVEGKTRDARFGALLGSVQLLGAQAVRALDKGRIWGLGQ